MSIVLMVVSTVCDVVGVVLALYGHFRDRLTAPQAPPGKHFPKKKTQ